MVSPGRQSRRRRLSGNTCRSIVEPGAAVQRQSGTAPGTVTLPSSPTSIVARRFYVKGSAGPPPHGRRRRDDPRRHEAGALALDGVIAPVPRSARSRGRHAAVHPAHNVTSPAEVDAVSRPPALQAERSMMPSGVEWGAAANFHRSRWFAGRSLNPHPIGGVKPRSLSVQVGRSPRSLEAQLPVIWQHRRQRVRRGPRSACAGLRYLTTMAPLALTVGEDDARPDVEGVAREVEGAEHLQSTRRAATPRGRACRRA